MPQDDARRTVSWAPNAIGTPVTTETVEESLSHGVALIDDAHTSPTASLKPSPGQEFSPSNTLRRLSSALGRTRSQPFFIGVAGGTASGKTTVCEQIRHRLHDQCVAMLSQDSFYRGLTPEESANVEEYNFDAPEAFDTAAIEECMQNLTEMRAVDVPVYDFSAHQRSTTESQRVEPADVVVIEGILVLHEPAIRNRLNMRIYVDTDDDVRLARRIQRDVQDRGRDVAGVLRQYTTFVKPAFDKFVAPSRKHADVIIPWARAEDNVVAIDLIAEHIKSKLQMHDLRRIFPNLQVIPSTYQIRGMHTIIRDQNTDTADFIFFADRLLRLVVEAGLGHLPFTERTVTTPTGRQYVGVEFAKKLCGVSIVRSGESMENALRACCKGIKIGKILVERVGDAATHQDLVYEKLPSDVSERHVLLLDPMLGCGSSAVRAIEVLLSKGVAENKILFLTLIAAPEGIRQVCNRFPRVTVVTSEIDEGVSDGYQVVPGCGGFGDRYFC